VEYFAVSILRHFTEKPWLTPQGAVLESALSARAGLPIAKVGLWVFLSVVSMLFMLLIAAFAGRMIDEAWRPGPDLGLLWFNTLALCCCSAAMQWASLAARRGRADDARSGMLAGGGLAIVFLLGQFVAWRQLASMGFLGMTIPAYAFFYLITGLHALHIAGGLVAWTVTTVRLWSGNEIATVRQSIELCTIYWHFLLAVWVVLFGLLFSGNNMSAVLAFCGFK
jgi:cytochrome c oxidase subunit III